MMSVEEYAIDVNKTVDEILKQCRALGIDVVDEYDLLDDYAITELDAAIASEQEEQEEKEEVQVQDVIVDNVKVTDETLVTKQKLVKKKDQTVNKTKLAKKDLQTKKKEMYKNKEQLMSNKEDLENVILYKENMTVSDLANALDVSAAELVKKLFTLGVMANVNNGISYENAEILVLDYGKELKNADTRDLTNFENYEIVDDPKDLVKRPPVVTIMGHVAHG